MVSKEYSKALYELADKNNQTDEINENLKSFVSLLNENPDFIKVLTYPKISNQDKKKTLKDTLLNFNDLFITFLYVLIDNNRINEINAIVSDYQRMVNESNGIYDVLVYSASKLDENQINATKQSLIKLLNAKSININNMVDESLIGGIKAFYDGKTFDLSVNNKLNSLKNSL